MEGPSSSSSSHSNNNNHEWSFQEIKDFETLIGDEKIFDHRNLQDSLFLIAFRLGRTVEEVTVQYNNLVRDVELIERGGMDLKISYKEDNTTSDYDDHHDCGGHGHQQWGLRPKRTIARGTRWNKKEHEMFLIGVALFGWSDWKSISNRVLRTRTSTQVASHAQKYYKRYRDPPEKKKLKRRRKTPSIHENRIVSHGRFQELCNEDLIRNDIIVMVVEKKKLFNGRTLIEIIPPSHFKLKETYYDN